MHKKFLLMFSGFITAVLAQGQADTAILHQVKEEALRHSQIPALAYYLTDVNGSRLTNSPGYRKAVSWTVKTFKDWGVQAAPEAWGEYGRGWSNEQAVIALQKPYYEPITGYAMPWTTGTNGAVTAGVVMISGFDSASIDKAGESIRGKIVIVRKRDTLVPPLFEGDAYRFADSELVTIKDHSMLTPDMIAVTKTRLLAQYNTKLYLASKGAIALLNGRGRDGTVFISSYLGYAKQYLPTLPEMVINLESYLKLQRMLSYGESPVLKVDIKNTEYTDDLTGYNVIAEIPGADPVLKDEVVMIGAHLDSWTSATGATDNAAGCVVMMEAFRILQKLGVRPKRTIRLALWGGEEEVILGSYGYVKKHFGDAATMKLLPGHDKISAYFNLDNGTGKIRGIYTQENEQVKEIFSAWLQPFNKDGVATVSPRSSGGSDQISFDAVGIPAFGFIQDPLDYDSRTHHSNMDVYDRLVIPDLQQNAVVVAMFAYNTATLGNRLPRKPLPAAGSFPLQTGLLPKSYPIR